MNILERGLALRALTNSELLAQLENEKKSTRALKAVIVELQQAMGITPSYSVEETRAS